MEKSPNVVQRSVFVKFYFDQTIAFPRNIKFDGLTSSAFMAHFLYTLDSITSPCRFKQLFLLLKRVITA